MAPRPHMRDSVQIGILDTVTSGPEPTEAWTYGSTIRCRFVKKSTTEVIDGDRHHMTTTDIHLPSSVTVTSDSRLKLTKRNRSVLGVAEYFDVVGDPWYTEDNKVVICACKSVPVGAE